LYIGLPQTQTDAINRYLEAQTTEINDEMKFIFNDAKDFARTTIIERQLPDFNQKRAQGNQLELVRSKSRRFFSFLQDSIVILTSLRIQNRVILSRKLFVRNSNRIINQVLTIGTVQSIRKSNILRERKKRVEFIFLLFRLALICSLATYLKRCDIKKCGNIPLEKIPKFFEREQRRLIPKLPRATRIKEHHLNEHQFTIQTSCKVCSKILWGINCQGYLCGCKISKREIQ